MKYLNYVINVIAVGIYLTFSTTVSAFTQPPYIPVIKPTPSRILVVDAAGGGDFTSLQAANASARSGDKFRVKAGVYPPFTWNSSGVSGKEIVIEAFGDGPVIVMGLLPNEVPGTFSGNWIILDGGVKKELIFDGSKNAITASKAVLYLMGSNITVSQVEVRNNGSSEGETILKGNNNKIYNSVYHHSEGEGIYVRDGSGHRIKNNIFYNNKSGGLQFNPHVDAENNNDVIVDGCIFYGNGYGAIDGNRGGMQIFIGAAGHTLSNITVSNNYFFNNNEWGIGIDYVSGSTMSNIYIINNTIYGNDLVGVRNRVPNTGILKNNIISQNQSINILESGGGNFIDKSNNLIAAVASDFSSTNPSDEAFLKLSATSSAIDAGTDLTGQLDSDSDGNHRPINKFYDIGADEYSATPEIKNITVQ